MSVVHNQNRQHYIWVERTTLWVVLQWRAAMEIEGDDMGQWLKKSDNGEREIEHKGIKICCQKEKDTLGSVLCSCECMHV